MAQWIEQNDSREATAALDVAQQEATFHALVAGAFDVPGGPDAEAQVDALAQANLPAYYRGQRFSRYKQRPLGNGVYDVTAQYGLKKPPGTVTLDFDLSSDKVRLKQSFASTYYPVPDAEGVLDPIDFNNAIRVTSHAGVPKVEGVDVDVPVIDFVVKRSFGPPDAPMTGDFVDGLFVAKAAPVNSRQIDVTISGISLTFLPGELRLKGATGSQKSGGAAGGEDGGWEGELSIKLGAAKNVVNGTVAGLAGVSYAGWDYVWVHYEEADGGGELLPKARQVCVEQVYERSDLSFLFT